MNDICELHSSVHMFILTVDCEFLPDQRLKYSHVCILNDLHDLQNEIMTNYFVLTQLVCLSVVLFRQYALSRATTQRKLQRELILALPVAELHKLFQGDDGIFHVSLTGTWWRMLLRTIHMITHRMPALPVTEMIKGSTCNVDTDNARNQWMTPTSQYSYG